MRVKANVSFGGQYAMRKNEICDLPDNPVTRALIDEGFITEAPEPEPEPEPKPEPEPEPEKPETNLHRLRRDDLVKICEEKGIKVSKKATKEELIAAIELQE